MWRATITVRWMHFGQLASEEPRKGALDIVGEIVNSALEPMQRQGRGDRNGETDRRCQQGNRDTACQNGRIRFGPRGLQRCEGLYHTQNGAEQPQQRSDLHDGLDRSQK